MTTHTIKFTKGDIEHVYLQSHQWDTWLEITLKSGSAIRSHSTELKDLILNNNKSYTAICTHRHYWLSTND